METTVAEAHAASAQKATNAMQVPAWTHASPVVTDSIAETTGVTVPAENAKATRYVSPDSVRWYASHPATEKHVVMTDAEGPVENARRPKSAPVRLRAFPPVHQPVRANPAEGTDVVKAAVPVTRVRFAQVVLAWKPLVLMERPATSPMERQSVWEREAWEWMKPVTARPPMRVHPGFNAWSLANPSAAPPSTTSRNARKSVPTGNSRN